MQDKCGRRLAPSHIDRLKLWEGLAPDGGRSVDVYSASSFLEWGNTKIKEVGNRSPRQ